MTKVVMPLPEVVTRRRLVDVYLQGDDSPEFTYVTAGQYGNPGVEHGARVSRVSIAYTKEGDDGAWNVSTTLYTRNRLVNGGYTTMEKTLRTSQWPRDVEEMVKALEREHEPNG